MARFCRNKKLTLNFNSYIRRYSSHAALARGTEREPRAGSAAMPMEREQHALRRDLPAFLRYGPCRDNRLLSPLALAQERRLSLAPHAGSGQPGRLRLAPDPTPGGQRQDLCRLRLRLRRHRARLAAVRGRRASLCLRHSGRSRGLGGHVHHHIRMEPSVAGRP